ncbi:hypothetical protein Ccrd_000339 [Cynara cardunculus var. scolymus]|uniref:Uncharacterized protein n=1 Tax=Cynara cardunculus var. scolymus TaxID=59895 RepID=A0A103XVB6_CYNCS|nr:hypothetical protein Ccrd_000339 [Cynara cardunculus var. scolymus]
MVFDGFGASISVNAMRSRTRADVETDSSSSNKRGKNGSAFNKMISIHMEKFLLKKLQIRVNFEVERYDFHTLGQRMENQKMMMIELLQSQGRMDAKAEVAGK